MEQRQRRANLAIGEILRSSIPASSISAVHPPRPLLRSPEGHSAIMRKLPPGGSTGLVRFYVFNCLPFWWKISTGNAATSRATWKSGDLKFAALFVMMRVIIWKLATLHFSFLFFLGEIFCSESSSLAENLATFRLLGFQLAAKRFLLFAGNFIFTRKIRQRRAPPEEATIQLAAECCCRCCGTKLFPAEFRSDLPRRKFILSEVRRFTSKRPSTPSGGRDLRALK